MHGRWRILTIGVLALATLLLAVACDDDDDDDNGTEVTGNAATQDGNPSDDSDDGDIGDSGSDDAGDSKDDWPDTIRLGFFGGDDADEVVERNEPMRLYLEERLDHPVEVFTGTSYTAVIEAMRAGRVEAMQVGPFSYILAVEEAQAEAMAVGQSCPADMDPCEVFEQSPHYYSIITTRKGSGIETIDDLPGRDLAFVDPASTSGHLAPKTFLLQAGIDPDNDMQTRFAGSHPTAMLALANGTVDAAATTEATLFNQITEGNVDGCFWPDDTPGLERTEEEFQELYENCDDGQVVIVARTEPIPSTPFAVRGGLPESLKTQLQEAMLDIQNQDDLVVEFRRWYVDPAADLGFDHLDQYYNPLRDMARLLDLDLHELAD